MRAVFAIVLAAMLAAALPVGSATAGDHLAPITTGAGSSPRFSMGSTSSPCGSGTTTSTGGPAWPTARRRRRRAATPTAAPSWPPPPTASVSTSCGRRSISRCSSPNAQERWLNGAAGAGETAAAAGWRRLGQLADPGVALTAVSLANKGDLVVAVYFQPPELTAEGPKERPGHAAIVRPSDKSVAAIERDGPDVIQAGMHNHRLVAMKTGFASHKDGWRDGTIEFFVHTTGFASASAAD